MNTVVGEPDAAVFVDSGLRRNDGEVRDVEWGQALARFRRAQTTLDSARSEPDEDVYDALLDAHSEALTALLALPAPGLPALAAKPCPERSRRIDVIVPQMAWELTGSEDCLEILRRDARRLAASAAGRQFTASFEIRTSARKSIFSLINRVSAAVPDSLGPSAPPRLRANPIPALRPAPTVERMGQCPPCDRPRDCKGWKTDPGSSPG